MLFALMFFQGILHGLGPDHVMAVANLSGLQRSRNAFGTGLRFGVGHSAVLILGAGLAAVGFGVINPQIERAGERLAGILLAALGAWTLIGLVRTRAYVHTHSHHHGSRDHEHKHVHFSRLHRVEHHHPHLSSLLGGLFALGGIRSLLLAAVPLSRAGGAMEATALVLLFAVGIVAAMTVVGVASGKLLERAGPGARSAVVLVVGAISLGLGAVWFFLS